MRVRVRVCVCVRVCFLTLWSPLSLAQQGNHHCGCITLRWMINVDRNQAPGREAAHIVHHFNTTFCFISTRQIQTIDCKTESPERRRGVGFHHRASMSKVAKTLSVWMEVHREVRAFPHFSHYNTKKKKENEIFTTDLSCSLIHNNVKYINYDKQYIS